MLCHLWDPEIQGESERHFVENPQKLTSPLLTMLLCQHTAPLLAQTLFWHICRICHCRSWIYRFGGLNLKRNLQKHVVSATSPLTSWQHAKTNPSDHAHSQLMMHLRVIALGEGPYHFRVFPAGPKPFLSPSLSMALRPHVQQWATMSKSANHKGHKMYQSHPICPISIYL